MAGEVRKRVQFGPWRTYQSVVEPHLADVDAICGSTDGLKTKSFNASIDPMTGAVYKRAGSTIVGDTAVLGIEQTGLLEAKWSARCRKLGPIHSRSLTSGASAPSALYTAETNPGFPTTDVGYFGTQYVKSDNSGLTTAQANYSLAEEFSSTHYPGNNVYTVPDMKIVPLWYESGDGGMTRGASGHSICRRFFTSGSRRWLDAGSYRYYPNLRGTPMRWGKRFNEKTASGSEPNRIFPTGPWPPLLEPGIAAGVVASGSDGNWSDGDFFYFSVIFQFEDGSYSQPMIPRAANANLSNGFLAVTIGAAGGASKYQNIVWSHIPIGYDGVVARILCRSNKMTWSSAAKTDLITLSPFALKICAVLKNNTQTTYNDTLGDDAGLLDDPNVVRFDMSCPRRARYIGTGDQRVLLTYTLPGPCAIMIAPVSSSVTDYDRNVDDSTAPAVAEQYHYRILTTGGFNFLELTRTSATGGGGSGNIDYTAVTGDAKKFTLSSYNSLQDLVDAINATSRTGTPECVGWRAALAPGADASWPTSTLLATVQLTSATCATHSNTTLDIGAFDAAILASIAVGMRVFQSSGADIDNAGTYVVSKNSTGVVLSKNALGTHGSLTMSFYNDTGDNGTFTGGSGTTVGYVRAFAPSIPGMIYFKRSALPGYDAADKSSVYFTVSSPGAATTGVSLAPNVFTFQNRRMAPAYIGQAMGIVDIEGAAILAFVDGMRMFVNQRGVTSGEDFDYRLVTINDHRGCISYDSLVAFHGCAAYATRDGIVITDKSRSEFIISGSIFHPTQRVGDIAYEIAQSIASSDQDADNEHFHAGILGSYLAIATRTNATYPTNAAGTLPTSVMLYDFSLGANASGIAALMDTQSHRPYSWSSQHSFNSSTTYGSYSCLCGFADPSGDLAFYGAQETNAGSTGDGRIDHIYTGTQDNGVDTDVGVTLPTVTSAPLAQWRLLRASVLHYSVNATAGQALLTLRTASRDGTANAATLALVVVVSNMGKFLQQLMLFASASRVLCDAFYFAWLDGASATGNRLYQVTVEAEEVPQ